MVREEDWGPSEVATAATDMDSLAMAKGAASLSLAMVQGPSSGTGSPSRREHEVSSHRGEKNKVKLHMERNAKVILALFLTQNSRSLGRRREQIWISWGRYGFMTSGVPLMPWTS